jgi:putative holliday junction resolvase
LFPSGPPRVEEGPFIYCTEIDGVLLFAMRVLAVDVGERRIGTALSDAGGRIAQGLKLLASSGSLSGNVAALTELVREFEVDRVVVGLPKNLDGTIGPNTQRIVALAKGIGEASGVPVDLWDERFSTSEAHRIFDMASIKMKKRKNVIDIMAAQIILQGYLDAQGHE